MEDFYEQVKNHTASAVSHLLQEADLEAGDIVVVGCSTSEVMGEKIGTASNEEVADAIFNALSPLIKKHNLYLALQCCEHLNRALVIEKACQKACDLDRVSVIPSPKAGGSLPRKGFDSMDKPVVVESIQAHAGIDIGDTFIGMHLKPVAVPVRPPVDTVGKAHLTMARTRPKLIGGERAVYRI